MELKDAKGEVVATVEAHGTPGGGVDAGVWVTFKTDDGSRPTLCFIKGNAHGHFGKRFFMGVYRDVNEPDKGCDFAISFDEKDGPCLQIVRGDEVRVVSLMESIDRLPALPKP